VAAGVATLVLVVGAVVGLRAATSHSSTVAGGDQGSGAAKKGRSNKEATVGILAGVHGSDLSVTTKDGRTVTVKTSGSTTVTLSVAATLPDVKIGDRVTVRGTSSAGNAMAADAISDAGAGRPGRGGTPSKTGAGKAQGGQSAGSFTGTVSVVNGDTITARAKDGTITTITAAPATKITMVKPSSLSALAVGQTVRAIGTTASNGSVTASAIQGLAGGSGSSASESGEATTTTAG